MLLRGPQPARAGDPDAAVVAAERLAVAGHNLHPCGRTRLGWDTTDVLAHDLEAGRTTVGFVAVRDESHLGDDLGAALTGAYPQLPGPPPGYRLQPVHSVAARRRAAHPVPRPARRRRAADPGRRARGRADRRPAHPAAAAGRGRPRRYLKVSLDIQVTSTRRSISVASTRNGPPVSALLHRLVADDPDGHRLLLLAETAGAAVPAGSGRDMAAILRDGLTGRLRPGERAVPGGALPFVAAGLARRVTARRRRWRWLHRRTPGCCCRRCCA